MKNIIHVDMDAYFAAIEIRENPSLKGKPLIVGGNPQSRGVVSTCSYEARKHGIHSGMSSFQAWQLCKNAIFVYPRFEIYKQVSRQIEAIFRNYSEIVEITSLDEAYIELKTNDSNGEYVVETAKQIKRAIFKETELTASAGVSYNKFLAKIGSDLEKPDGLVYIPPERTQEILFKLPIHRFYGIGKVTAARMAQMGILTGKDLYQISLPEMIRRFGKPGCFYYQVVRGIDERELVTHSEPKSISNENTFSEDLDDYTLISNEIKRIAFKLSGRMKKKQLLGKYLFLKMKYDNFESVMKSLILPFPTNDPEFITEMAERLVIRHWQQNRKIRLIGIGFNKLEQNTQEEQPDLFESDDLS